MPENEPRSDTNNPPRHDEFRDDVTDWMSSIQESVDALGKGMAGLLGAEVARGKPAQTQVSDKPPSETGAEKPWGHDLHDDDRKAIDAWGRDEGGRLKFPKLDTPPRRKSTGWLW